MRDEAEHDGRPPARRRGPNARGKPGAAPTPERRPARDRPSERTTERDHPGPRVTTPARQRGPTTATPSRPDGPERRRPDRRRHDQMRKQPREETREDRQRSPTARRAVHARRDREPQHGPADTPEPQGRRESGTGRGGQEERLRTPDSRNPRDRPTTAHLPTLPPTRLDARAGPISRPTRPKTKGSALR